MFARATQLPQTNKQRHTHTHTHTHIVGEHLDFIYRRLAKKPQDLPFSELPSNAMTSSVGPSH